MRGPRGAAPAGRWSRPVLYLDIDDTLLVWADGRPRAAPGAADFLRWALERFEVRWLTRWCRYGTMPRALLRDLSRMLDLPPGLLRPIRGQDWHGKESKVEGILWLEHLVLERPFLWLEDEYGLGEFERSFLERHGFAGCWVHCNVSVDHDALGRVHRRLEERYD